MVRPSKNRADLMVTAARWAQWPVCAEERVSRFISAWVPSILSDMNTYYAWSRREYRWGVVSHVVLVLHVLFWPMFVLVSRNQDVMDVCSRAGDLWVETPKDTRRGAGLSQLDWRSKTKELVTSNNNETSGETCWAASRLRHDVASRRANQRA